MKNYTFFLKPLLGFLLLIGIFSTQTLTAQDKDLDAILDNVDLDDDNDGIPDTVEGIYTCTTVADLNTPGFATNTNLVTGGATGTATLNGLDNGTFNFTASVSGTATWNGGIQIQNQASVGNFIYAQPQNASNSNPANIATYEFDFPNAVSNFAFFIGGLNNGDRATITAFNGLTPIAITAANFSDFSTPQLVPNGNTVIGNEYDNSANPLINTFKVTIPEDIDRVVVTSGKSVNDNNNVTTGMYSFSYCSALAGIDFDKDGIPNSLDLDSDDDGIFDIYEAGGTDADGDGKVDGLVDADGDGLNDAQDNVDNGSGAGEVTNGTPLPLHNTDGTGQPDYLDIDSDDDGIVDNIEGQPTVSFNPPLDADDDMDGIDNQYDNDFAGNNAFTAENTDGDSLEDYRDRDSDNDGDDDQLEGWDHNSNGTPSTVPSNMDSDGDGLDDAFDADDAEPDPDNNQVPTDFPDAQEPGGDRDWRDFADIDNDGVADNIDLDNDNDGIPDSVEGTGDTDGDGIPDHLDLDSDNDGVPDILEAGGTDANGDGQIDYPTPGDPMSMNDANNDGLDDGVAATPLPDTDSDGDGLADRLDLDSDNDGIADIIEAGGTDANGDGQVDYATPGDPTTMVDVDGDGFIDTIDSDDNSMPGVGDGGTPLADADTDGDGLPNRLDLDSDNDGIHDVVESGGTDTNMDGRADDDDDNADNTGSNGIPTSAGGGNTPTDTGADGSPDYTNLDSDGDGCSDANEAYASAGADGGDGGQYGTGTPAATSALGLVTAAAYNTGTVATVTDAADATACMVLDSDGDGIDDNVDLDNDNDGIPDSVEGMGDTDGDGIPNHLDLDSDNDGVPDIMEAGGTDTNGDGQIDYPTPGDPMSMNDANNDGLDDGAAATPLPDTDSDGDGLVDRLDLDSDNDGIADIVEAGGTDANGDGQVDYATPGDPTTMVDVDGDGFIDTIDSDDNSMPGVGDGGTPLADADTDGDGLPNRLDLDSDNDGIHDVVESGGGDTNMDGRADDDDNNADNTGSNGIPTSAGGGNTPTDTGADGSPDYTNLDSDGDGCSDANEAYASAGADGGDGGQYGTGTPAATSALGLVTAAAYNTGAVASVTDAADATACMALDSDGDGIDDNVDLDNDNDGIPDSVEGMGDTDGDGIPDHLDLDSDNDGVPDIIEAGGTDTNGDGQIDYPTPGDPMSMNDTNNDGLDDGVAATPLPDTDSDGDGLVDRLDLDSDNDGIADIVEAGGTDANGDGQVDYATPGDPTTMPDVDGDGFIDTIDTNDNTVAGVGDGGTALPDIDTDGPGRPNRLDLDSDNDGIYDVVESGGTDTNMDGRADDDDNNADNTGSNGIPTSAGGGNTPTDTGADGSPDYTNLDSDGDGCSDANEAYANANADGGDNGVFGAGIPTTDASGLVTAATYDTGAVAAVTDATDTTACDVVDTDGDGVLDNQEIADGTDPNNPCDFVIASITGVQGGDWSMADCDGDGVTNGQEVADGTNPEDPCDFNAAGITLALSGDYLISDCDGDGVTNGTEITDGTNPENPCDFLETNVTLDRSGDWLTADCDGDMISNGQETTDGTNPKDSCSNIGGTPPPEAVCDIIIETDLVNPGVNDGVFRITNIEAYPDNDVKIYNRWGILVFETQGYDNASRAFRGISNGRATIQMNKELPVGVYFYIINYSSTGTSGTKSGYLYVNR